MSDLERAKTLFFEALAFMDSADFKSAESRLRDALTFSPGHATILTNLSVVLLGLNRPAEAGECAERAIAADPKNVEALLVLAECRARAARLAEALAVYDQIIALDPGIVEAHNNRGIVLERL